MTEEEGGQTDAITAFEGGREPQAREYMQSLEAKKDKALLEPQEETLPCKEVGFSPVDHFNFLTSRTVT